MPCVRRRRAHFCIERRGVVAVVAAEVEAVMLMPEVERVRASEGMSSALPLVF